MAARAVPAVGMPTARELRAAYMEGVFMVPWADVPIDTRRRWAGVAVAMDRARDASAV